MQTYLRQAERLASEKIGQPVTVQSAHVFLLPSPRVVASDILVGKNQEVKVETLVVIPTISSLFSKVKLLDLHISKPVIKKAALDFVTALTANKSDSIEATAVNISHIKIDQLQLVWSDGINLPTMNAEAMLTSNNNLQSATVETEDGKLDAKVEPNGNEHLIVLNARKWVLPVGLPLLIDNAKFEMHLKGSKLAIPKIDVALYGGKLSGDAVLDWTNAWHINGKVNIENLSVLQPSLMLSKAVYLSGNLFGKGNFSSTAKVAGQLPDRLQSNFQFKVNNGVLHGLDLVKLASLLIKQSQSGGETQFDEFSGVLNASGKQHHLRNLKIRSGLLSATGQVKVKPNKALDGVVDVEVKNSMGLAAIPLEVSGTVSKPVVLPSKAALAGAIAGTAILGPGVGTSLGVKAAGAVDKLKGLFGGK